MRRAVAGQEDLAEIALRRAMAQRRAKIRKSAGAYSPDPQKRYSAQKFARDRGRRLKKKILKHRTWSIPKNLLVRRKIPSMLLDLLDPKRERRWRPLIARKFKRYPDRVGIGSLNFLDDPVGTMEEFEKLSIAESTEVSAFLDFGDAHCVDIGGYLVLAEIWPQLTKIFRGGRMSLPVQKVLSAIHLDQELQIGLTGVRDHHDVWAFPIRHRRPRGTTASTTADLQPQEREKVADELCELVNEWLEVAGRENDDDIWELSDEGKALISTMSGELLCNAERHSFPGSSDGDWSMTAFMAARKNNDGKRELRCYMAFLSVGQSISESFASAPAELLEKAEVYLGQFGRSGPSRDTLMTVLALQDAVTSDPVARRDQRGGTGLQDVLDFVGDLGAAHSGNADVRVTIVSGKSCIRLKHPILVGTRDTRGRRVQWCNSWNDPSRPPDKDVAFDLPRHFAGTLVSAGFTLDPRLYVGEDEIDGFSN